MKFHFFILVLFYFSISNIQAKQPRKEYARRLNEAQFYSAQQEFKLMVFESPREEGLSFEKVVGSSKRGFIDEAWDVIRGAYSNTFYGQLTATSASIMSTGIGMIVESIRDKKNDWMTQVRKDCYYSRTFPMQEEITDFYGSTSSLGALDPNDIVFSGFGCQQILNVKIGNETKSLIVVDLACRLDTSALGRQYILNYGKFKVIVDHLYFNPMLCNLPNDSLSANYADLHTPFDFERRKNLQLTLNAKISSSWMNQAIEIATDKQLGEFTIKVNIPDSTLLDQSGSYEGYFTYNPKENPDDTLKNVIIDGECFMVPRSFVGTEDMKSYNSIWGTGRYKIDMTMTETCEINMDFYCKKNDINSSVFSDNPERLSPQLVGKRIHWNSYWTEEWNKIKKRRKIKSIGFWNGIWNDIKKNYEKGRWVYTITDPVASVLIDVEKKEIAEKLDKWLDLPMGTSATGTFLKSPSVPSTTKNTNYSGGMIVNNN